MTDTAFDTETTGLSPYTGDRPFLVQAADDEAPNGVDVLCGPAIAPRSNNSYPPLKEMKARLDRADRLVAHNLAFDVHHVWVGPGWDLLDGRPLADTAILAQIVAPERRFAKPPENGDTGHAGYGYKLKVLAQDYVDPNAKDSELELEALAKKHGFSLKAKPDSKNYCHASYFELWKREPEAMEHYGREDTRLTLGLIKALEAELTDNTRRIWDLEQKVAPIVIAAERQGIQVNQEAAYTLRADYALQRDAARAELDKQLGDGWEQNNEELAERLVMAGVPLTETTDSGQLATNKWALDRLGDEHPVVRTLQDYRLYDKFITTYLDHFTRDHVIHPSFQQIGTWTGRMACRTPNMQNIPARAGTAVRDLFVPRQGHAFVGIDFEQIELRLLGYYLNDPKVQELIEQGRFFEWVCTQVWGGHEEEYRKGAAKESFRTIAKNTTYAIVYGAGGMKIAKMLGWEPDGFYTADDWVVKRGYKQIGEPRCRRAEDLIKSLKTIWRGYWDLAGPRGRIQQQVQEIGYVTTILGRKQWLDFDGGWKGLSGLIQGSAADLFKLAVVEATPVAAELGGYPLLFIHDEIVFEVPTNNAPELLERCGRAMEECYELTPRLGTEGAIGYKTWGEAK